MPRTYADLYAKVRLRLRQPNLSDENLGVLHSTLADEITQERLASFIQSHDMTTTQFEAGVGLADLNPPGVEYLGFYAAGSPRRLQTLPVQDLNIANPYVVVRSDIATGYNLGEDGDWVARYFSVYDLDTGGGAADMFYNRNRSLFENGLLRIVLEWQMAQPEEILPFDAKYREALKVANRNLNISRGVLR